LKRPDDLVRALDLQQFARRRRFYNRPMRRAPRVESFLARLPLFDGLGADELQRLAAGTTRRELARGGVLFREGERSTGVHALVFGRIKLASRGVDGRERLVDLVTPGRTFGEPMMFLDKPYIVTATALADSVVLTVARDAILAELARNAHFASRIIGTLSARVEALVHELEGYALGSGTRRFVAWLLRRPLAVGASGAATVTLPAAKRVLAKRLNVSAEHLSRILRGLSAEGLIAVRGRDVSIADVERLRAWLNASAADDRQL
jgi:CRP-like cAMP-binding protein